MRSAAGTKSRDAGVVTLVTESTIDFLAGPSVHDGSTSAAAVVTVNASAAIASRIAFTADYFFASGCGTPMANTSRNVPSIWSPTTKPLRMDGSLTLTDTERPSGPLTVNMPV